jgi:hypothetical protein
MAFCERWTLPRRELGISVAQEAIRQGGLRSDIDAEDVIDLLYAPIYYRLQMGTGPLSEAYVDKIFDRAMRGFEPRP